MKKLLFITLCYLFLSGCNGIDKLTQFHMSFNEPIVIPATTVINLPLNLLTPDIPTNSESTFSVNDTRKDLIEEIKLEALRLTLTAPINDDFGFLKSVSVYIIADGLPETKVAWKDNVPVDIGQVIDMEVSDADLKEYIKKDKFVLRVSTITDELMSADHHVDLASVFFVDAKILGQ